MAPQTNKVSFQFDSGAPIRCFAYGASHTVASIWWLPYGGSHMVAPIWWLPYGGSHTEAPIWWLPLVAPIQWFPYGGSHTVAPIRWLLVWPVPPIRWLPPPATNRKVTVSLALSPPRSQVNKKLSQLVFLQGHSLPGGGCLLVSVSQRRHGVFFTNCHPYY